MCNVINYQNYNFGLFLFGVMELFAFLEKRLFFKLFALLPFFVNTILSLPFVRAVPSLLSSSFFASGCAYFCAAVGAPRCTTGGCIAKLFGRPGGMRGASFSFVS